MDVSYGCFGAWKAKMRTGGLLYVLKGFDHSAFHYNLDGSTENIAAALGIDHRGQQGIIPIKRCGTSENIGQTARRRANWPEMRDIATLHRALHP